MAGPGVGEAKLQWAQRVLEVKLPDLKAASVSDTEKLSNTLTEWKEGPLHAAWKAKAKALHPDRQPDPAKKADAETAFKEVGEAYDFLKTLKVKVRQAAPPPRSQPVQNWGRGGDAWNDPGARQRAYDAAARRQQEQILVQEAIRLAQRLDAMFAHGLRGRPPVAPPPAPRPAPRPAHLDPADLFGRGPQTAALVRHDGGSRPGRVRIAPGMGRVKIR